MLKVNSNFINIFGYFIFAAQFRAKIKTKMLINIHQCLIIDRAAILAMDGMELHESSMGHIFIKTWVKVETYTRYYFCLKCCRVDRGGESAGEDLIFESIHCKSVDIATDEL